MEKFYLFIIISICLVYGCEDEISFPPPPHDPALVLFSTIDQNQTEIFVSNTVGLKRGEEPSLINGAFAKIEDEDGNIFLNQVTQDGLILANSSPENGKKYTITVEKQGFETIQSTTQMPPSFNIDSLKIELSDSISLDSNSFLLFYTVEIELEEPSEDIEYYEITAIFPARLLRQNIDTTYLFDGLKPTNFFPLQNTQLIELETAQVFFIKNDGSKKIRFGAEFNLTKDEYLKEVKTTIKSSTQEKYDYASSVINQIGAGNGNIITLNPIEALTNIENGFGFFTAHHIDTISKRIPR